ncbi:hypothetical protein FF011L_18270 [Roseimaritima multifibrata]|uniref:Uncharacterized protein n=1 Tax=Roseimaritima multifibrata TaxID=1930274 RepID=A0A517MDV5_9BACT|nr:hypothetical protein [Roseimaritima multifibrata]QDS93072.1 hypothetical protein FF011L_18270 [Roseimaritima multifibrata]
MRLTLRTLLALRNRTLRPEDEQVLQAKVQASSYAQQLLELIQSVLSNPRLSALSPTATGPTDDPNIMAEYIDSTLPPEQAAEVDRTCLESPLHMAEAAGAHEVLTLVLKEPAHFSPQLRDRIYRIGQGAQVTQEGAVENVSPHPAVTPVSAADSGAFMAATRLKEEEQGTPLGDSLRDERIAKAAIAGSREWNAADASEIFGDRIRATRVVPWLVALALIAVFLFAMKQAFSPLLPNSGKQVAEGSGKDAVPLLPGTEPDELETEQPDPAKEPDTPSSDAVAVTPDKVSDEPAVGDPDKTAAAVPVITPPAMETTEQSPPPPAETVAPPKPADAVVAAVPADRDGKMEENPGDDSVQPPPAKPPAEGAEVPPQPVGVATTASDLGLLLSLLPGGNKWSGLAPESPVADRTLVFSPPTFRSQLTVPEKYDLVLMGGTRSRLHAGEQTTEIELETGKLLVTALQADLSVPFQTGTQQWELELVPESGSAAVEASIFRSPGADPRIQENLLEVVNVYAVTGPLKVRLNGADEVTLETGQRWQKIGEGAGKVDTLETPPAWIATPAPDTIAESARQNLLQLLAANQDLELGLREATRFRKAEVAALAAETLCAMGKCDIYFGADGILNEGNQKNFFQDHVAALKQRMDLNSAAAKALQKDAETMDAAAAQTLFRLLWDYSPEQLEAKADEELVAMLDSPQMPVRILASESLRRITGTNLFFKPEQENPARRKTDIKKWETRLRRGDIRWEAVPIAGQ